MDAMYWVEGEKFAKMVNVAAEQFRRVMPVGEIYVYTSRKNDCKSLNRHDLYEVVELPALRHMRPMVANLHAQVHYVLTRFRNPTLFLDADTLVQHAFSIDPGADLMVTWRDELSPGVDENIAKMMPYNYGVIGANPTWEATEAFIWMRQRVSEYHKGLQDWYGNQSALRELVGPVTKGTTMGAAGLPFDLLVQHLPCALYNYTPTDADSDMSTKMVLHVKGDRKHLFEDLAARMRGNDQSIHRLRSG